MSRLANPFFPRKKSYYARREKAGLVDMQVLYLVLESRDQGISPLARFLGAHVADSSTATRRVTIRKSKHISMPPLAPADCRALFGWIFGVTTQSRAIHKSPHRSLLDPSPAECAFLSWENSAHVQSRYLNAAGERRWAPKFWRLQFYELKGNFKKFPIPGIETGPSNMYRPYMGLGKIRCSKESFISLIFYIDLYIKTRWWLQIQTNNFIQEVSIFGYRYVSNDLAVSVQFLTVGKTDQYVSKFKNR